MPSLDPVVYVQYADKGWSNRRIATELGVDESTVRRGLSRIKYQRHLLPVHRDTDRYDFDLDTPIVVTGDVMVTADWHIPLYDPHLVNVMIEKARELELTTLIIAGDFFNYDALSQYDPKQTEAGLEREHAEAIGVMRVLLETFERIIFVWGNHDARMHKALGYKIRFASAMRMVFGSLGEEALGRVEFTNLDHVIVQHSHDPSNLDWYICHPANYTSIPLSGARKIANKVNRNVVTAHSHHAAIGLAEDGNKIVIEAGGLHDRTKTAYLQRTTTFPTWAQGFLWIIDGRPTLYSPKFQNG